MNTAIALGTFDGLHAGHRAVIAATEGFYRMAYTFSVPPKLFINGKSELIMTSSDREAALKELGIDKVVMNDFGSIRSLSADDFLVGLLRDYKPSRIACGFNYHFGNAAAGDTEMLERFCKENGIEFVLADAVMQGGEVISSSAIRKLIKSGDIIKANSLTYKPFSFSAEVVNGDRRGRTIGFPTANQDYPCELVTPEFGVYSSTALIDGIEYKGITNIGMRPTYEKDRVTAETYLVDFDGDIYGKQMVLRPERFLRKEKKFSSLQELKNAIKKDVQML